MAEWYQGVINHLEFPMVDATDFDTLEVGLTGITLKIYGTLNGNSTAPSLLVSGTHSFVAAGQSVTEFRSGVYHIAIRPSDLSTASAAFYDHYVFWASDTGTAIRVINIDGKRYDSSNIYSLISDMNSTMGSQFAVTNNFLSNISLIVSDVQSALDSQFVVTSNYLSNISLLLSDIDSALTSQFTYTSNLLSGISNIQSGMSNTLSAVLVDTADISDIASQILGDTAYISDQVSNLTSRITNNIASMVWNAEYSNYSAGSTFGSLMSDIYSRAGAGLVPSDISDIASAVWAQQHAAHSLAGSFGSLFSLMATGVDNTESRTLRIMSDTSDLISRITDNVASMVWDAALVSHVDVGSFGATVNDISSRTVQTESHTSKAYSQALDLSAILSDVNSAVDSQFAILESNTSKTYSHVIASIAEPAAGVPTANPTTQEAIMYMYMALRNKVDVDSNFKEFHKDNGTVLFKKAVSFSTATSTYTEGEGVAP